MHRWWMDFVGSFEALLGAFEGAYSPYSSRMQRRRDLTTPKRRRHSMHYTLLAEVLNKNPDVVSWWVGEGIRRRLADRDFATQMDRLDVQLSSALIQPQRYRGGDSSNSPTSLLPFRINT